MDWGLSDFLGYADPLAKLTGAYLSYNANKDAQKALLASQANAQKVMAPYQQTGQLANQQLSDRLTSGFNPTDLASDPGYQFRLQEGQKALNATLAAQGLGQSGAAMKAAQGYGQGMASQEYEDAYNRWLKQNAQLAGSSGQGLASANALGEIYGNVGSVNANALVGRSNILNQTLSSFLGDGGIFNKDKKEETINWKIGRAHV